MQPFIKTAHSTDGKDQFKLFRTLQDIGDNDTPHLSERWQSFNVQQQRRAKTTSWLCGFTQSHHYFYIHKPLSYNALPLRVGGAPALYPTVRNIHTYSINDEGNSVVVIFSQVIINLNMSYGMTDERYQISKGL